MSNLRLQICHDAIDLLDHCLGQYLHLDSDFDCRGFTASNCVSGIHDRSDTRDQISERSVTPPRLDTPPNVRSRQCSRVFADARREFPRLVKVEHVLIEVHCYSVPEVGASMEVLLAIEERS